MVLYASSVAILGLVLYYWYDNFGLQSLWIPALIVAGLALLFGYLFARYALSPLASRNEELDRLLKDTLHELNIPVATIKANVQMLKRKADEKSRARLERIESAANQLLGLYKEVDYLIKSQIDRIEKERFGVDEAVRERVEFFKDLLGSRKVVLDLEPFEAELPKQGFAKAFDNLLSNAIKYSSDDSAISITLKDGRLTIEDEGEGIDSSDLLRIFDRYYRAAKDEPGYGIGLDIVKKFCDEEGIEIAIDSQKGRGTRITLDLTHI